MCNGESGRSSQGGTIAILRPPPQRTSPSSPREISLRFVQDSAETTAAIFDGLDASHGEGRVLIHRDGDLVSGSMNDASVLYSIRVPQGVSSAESFSLAHRLDLTVGGHGVIGRRISLLRDQIVVGQGIIGWN